MTSVCVLLGFVFGLTGSATGLLEGDVIEEAFQAKALEVFNLHKDAIVTVELVVRQRFAFLGMDSESEETRLETTGTVIDATGLTVLPLSSTDPMGMMGAIMGGMLGEDVQMQSEVADVRILSNGTSIPAGILLRDKDHDLAFVRPLEAPDPPLSFFDLEEAGQPALLEPLVVIERMGRVANRVHAVSLTRVKAVVERPRRFYMANTAAIGAPALTMDGRFTGIFVMRTLESRGTGGFSPMSLLSNVEDSIAIILIPASVIREGALQAPLPDASGPEDTVAD